MNQGPCFQIVRASTWARKYVIVQEWKLPSEGATQLERQIEIARGPNLKTSRKLRQKSFESQTTDKILFPQ